MAGDQLSEVDIEMRRVERMIRELKSQLNDLKTFTDDHPDVTVDIIKTVKTLEVSITKLERWLTDDLK